MHYTKLNKTDNKEDHFDPRQLIDLDDDDLAEIESQFAKKNSPKGKKKNFSTSPKQASLLIKSSP